MKKFLKRTIAFILIGLIGVLSFYDVNTIGQGMTGVIIDQNKVDIYYPELGSVRDAASQFTITDSDGNVYKAICADYPDAEAPNGTNLTINESNDRNLLKVLYYGYDGPMQWSGFNYVPAGAITSSGSSEEARIAAYARVATTICATAVRKGVTPRNTFALGFWNYLFGDNPAPDIPDVNLGFSQAEEGACIINENGNKLQKSVEVFVTGNSYNNTYVNVSEPFSMYYKQSGADNYIKYTNQNVLVSGGGSFYITAPMWYEGEFSIPQSRINQQQYYVLVEDPDNDGYQTLAALRLRDVYTNSVSLRFTPVSGNIDIITYKKDDNSCGIENVLFSVKYYREIFDSETEINGLLPVRSWCFKTDSNGECKYLDSYKVDGDSLFYKGNIPVIPVGTVVIQEISAPNEYIINNEVFVRKIDYDINENCIVYNPPTVYNAEKQGCIRIEKNATNYEYIDDGLAEYYTKLQGVQFDIYAQGDVCTPNGTIIYHKDELVESIYTNEEGIAVTNNLPMGQYRIKEVIGDTNRYYEVADDLFVELKYSECGVAGSYEKTVRIMNKAIKPEISTYAYNFASSTNTAAADAALTIIDILNYSNLQVGKEYKAIAQLYNIDDECMLTDEAGNVLCFEKSFIPENTDGNIDVQIDMNASELEGKSIVVFETLVLDNKIVAIHKQKDNENQTICFPKINTMLSSGGEKEAEPASELELTDEVYYNNLRVGENYELVGYLIYKDLQEYVKDTNGQIIKAIVKFVPDSSDGTINVEFRFNADNIDVWGRELVCYEELYSNNVLVAFHKELDNANQTIMLKELPPPEGLFPPEEPTTEETTTEVKITTEQIISSTETPQEVFEAVAGVQTGDNTNMMNKIIIALISLVGIMVLFISNRRTK